MDFQIQLDSLDVQLQQAIGEQRRAEARTEGLQRERSALWAAAAASRDAATPLTELSRARAIVAVLRQGNRPMRTRDIVNALSLGGREEEPHTVTVYLDRLRKDKRIERVGYGLYMAAPQMDHH